METVDERSPAPADPTPVIWQFRRKGSSDPWVTRESASDEEINRDLFEVRYFALRDD